MASGVLLKLLVTVEEFLVAVGEKVGYEHVAYASRMNKEVVVFLKEEHLVDQMVERGVILKGGVVMAVN